MAMNDPIDANYASASSSKVIEILQRQNTLLNRYININEKLDNLDQRMNAMEANLSERCSTLKAMMQKDLCQLKNVHEFYASLRKDQTKNNINQNNEVRTLDSIKEY
eukprot:TRINITY_DN74871_c0_g1_i1.p7 TRINITY_DN74871_c0_g1~~TRINITY_DN74871_c0_g1_i1.p7  ORF type:complete len:107 (-),score=6.76 TRINITY_DN74871_c0_g1_i1:705-1025(-)